MLFSSDETKSKILLKFLQIAAFEGWNFKALQQATEEAGIEEKFLPLIFEGGILELTEFYIDFFNEKSAEKISQDAEFSQKKIREKIAAFIHARFLVEKDNIIAAQQLRKFYLNPKNFTEIELGARPVITALRHNFKIADFIWKSINDNSTDFNFYTKRATLAKILFRCFNVFVNDDSSDLEQLRSFIDKEIDKVMKFEKFKNNLKNSSYLKAAKDYSKGYFEENFFDEAGALKAPKEIIKSLPFIRLIKF